MGNFVPCSKCAGPMGDYPGLCLSCGKLELQQGCLATQELLLEEISEVFANLSPRERDILHLRFGLSDGRQRTLEEVAELLGVERSSVRRMETEAFRKLRKPSDWCDHVDGTSVFRRFSRSALSKILRRFTGRDNDILGLKWGFKDGKIHTAEEVAKAAGVTALEVKRLEAKALKAL